MSYCKGQLSSINGVVHTENHLPLPSVTITLHKKMESALIAFAISNKDGAFEIKLNAASTDTLELKASLIGYTTQSFFFVANEKTDFSFYLSPKNITLKEVKVKSPPIWQRKDTINYNTSEFKQQQDRVIGDIIARLPGIEITLGGQIKYQGKPINKYYIEGLDLLEDRYSIANNNIPADVVDKIQILENHQPIRLLDSVSFSDRAALNIKLKDEAKMRLIGQARLGLGALPLLTEDEVVAMLFKKKTQLINTYKYNNTGLDNSRDLTSQNIEDYINAIQSGSIKNDIISVVKPPPPPLIKNRYLFNNAHTVSINQLFPLDNIHQLRVNASYINDYQKQLSSVSSRFFLPLDTVLFFENNNTRENTNQLQTDITLLANSPNYYLKNLLRFQGAWQPNTGFLVNNTSLTQRSTSNFHNILNDFKLIKIKKKSILEWATYLSYVSHPQNLLISPGLYAELLNFNNPYDATFQTAQKNTFYTDNYFLQRKRLGRFTTLFKIGTNWQQKRIETLLFTRTAGIQKPVADSFANKLEWNRHRVYLETVLGYEHRSLKISAALPINYTAIKYQNTLTKSIKQNGLVFNPSLSFMLQLSPKWDWKNTYSYTNKNFGDAEQVTDGYILKTYRQFSNNDSPLPIQEMHSLSSYISFRDPLKTIFLSTGITYANNSSNIIYRQFYTGSLETLLAELLNNSTESFTLFARLNKYIIDWKTSFSLNTNYSFGKQKQLQQDILSTFINKSFSVGVNINAKLTDKANVDYNATGYQYLSKTKKTTGSKIYSANQKMTFNYFPTASWGMGLSGDHFYLNTKSINQQNYYFFDLNIRLKPIKGKIDWELLVQNIFNTQQFISASNTNNAEIISLYELRPRQILLKAGFRL